MHILFSIIFPFLFLPWSRIPPDVFTYLKEYVHIQMPDMEKVQAAIGGTINIDAPLNIRGNSGAFTASKFSDSANSLYFIEPASTGNSMIVAGKVGIGTTNPVGALDVKGTIRLLGATSGYVNLVAPAVAGTTTFTLPSANGTADQVLRTDGAGNLTWLSLESIALPWTSCGNPFTVTHTQGVVAPVTKTVTYGTVNSSLTGSAKCWITKNLGATDQATVVTDSTEPSAGWYWQFNRAQGRQYTTSVSPAWTITAISEDLNWASANDPCALLLGTGWRLPTSTEWTSADANGPWASYTDTFASVLKLHAAGYLGTAAGALADRGVGSNYWSSTQSSVTNGWALGFTSASSNMGSYSKAYGFTARCLRD
jgi:hypothetical protein